MTMIDPAERSAIDAAIAASDMDRAITLAEAALKRGGRDPLLFRLVARRYEEAGDYQRAYALLAAAIELVPDDVDTLGQLGTLLRKAGDRQAALQIFDGLIGRGVDEAGIWLERGYVLHAANDFRAADESYRRALAIDGDCAAALAGVAETSLQLSDRAAAGLFAEQALVRAPANVVAAHVLAQLDLDDRRPAAAESRLSALLGRDDLTDAERIQSLTLFGNALDQTGDTGGAFAAFADAQSRYRRLYAPMFGDEVRGQRALISHVHTQFQRANTAAWRIPAGQDDCDVRRHLFLLGYPRSGTTLVETILTSLPDVVAVEEKPTLADTEQLFLRAADGMDRLARIGAVDAARYRRLYWDRVAAFGEKVGGKTFVDMDPLKGINLPVIARLFPQAGIIVMRRDPRDVMWSCFRQNFHATPAGYAFSDLESAARHYDALMALTQDCLDQLPIDSFILRYEDLVNDFEAVTQRLCAFADLEWSPSVAAFDRTAAHRAISTASVRQVRRGLFNGTGQWRRYEEQLARILPILQPWVERFGYAD